MSCTEPAEIEAILPQGPATVPPPDDVLAGAVVVCDVLVVGVVLPPPLPLPEPPPLAKLVADGTTASPNKLAVSATTSLLVFFTC